MAIERDTEPGKPRASLTAKDVQRLTLFKWRYRLESTGFSSKQIDHLMFLKWLNRQRKSLEDMAPEIPKKVIPNNHAAS